MWASSCKGISTCWTTALKLRHGVFLNRTANKDSKLTWNLSPDTEEEEGQDVAPDGSNEEDQSSDREVGSEAGLEGARID